MIFGKRSTVLDLWFPPIKRWWLGGPDSLYLIFVRCFGVLLLGFLGYVLFAHTTLHWR